MKTKNPPPYYLPAPELEKFVVLTRAKRAQQGRDCSLYNTILWRLEMSAAIAQLAQP